VQTVVDRVVFSYYGHKLPDVNVINYLISLSTQKLLSIIGEPDQSRGCHSNSHCTAICDHGQSEGSMDKGVGRRTTVKLFPGAVKASRVSRIRKYSENKRKQVNGQD